MGLSTTAAYGILFTASLLMLATLLNSIIYSYTLTNQGMENRSNIIQGSKNIVKIDRIVYNSSKIEIFVYNQGPFTLNMNHTTLLVNGSIANFTYQSQYWYPATENILLTNGSYSFGSSHQIQFNIDIGDDVIASAELNNIYLLNASAVIAYSYSGSKLWSTVINDPLDIAVGEYLYVLNSTEILIYTLQGNYVNYFGRNLNITAIDAYNTYVYGVSNDTLYIFNSTGTLVSSISITSGKDVAVGKYVYVLEGNDVYEYSYSGTYISYFTDWRITNATKISSDPDMDGAYVFILNNKNEILVYNYDNYVADISLGSVTRNIDIYGKIYLCSSGVLGMNMGYRIKIVDEYGNEIYGYL